MKPFLRTFSLVLAAVVLAFGCMSLPTGAVGAVTADNAVVTTSDDLFAFPNGDFECGEIYGWSLYSADGSKSTLYKMIDADNTKAVTEEKHGGQYAMQVVRTDTGSDYLELRAELRNPVPGTAYAFTYYGKTTDSAKFHSDIFLRYLDDAGDPVTLFHIAHADAADYITATGVWEQRSYRFLVPESYGDHGDLSQLDTLYVDFRLVEYGAGTVYLDDVTVEESAEPTYGSNKIDSNFTSAGWRANGGAVTDAAEKKAPYTVYSQDFAQGLGYYTGNGKAFSLGIDPLNPANQTLRYTGKNAWDYEGQYSGSLFTAGEEYTLTFRYYAIDMKTATSPVTVQCGFSGTLTNILTISRVNSTEWTEISYTFTAGTIASSTRLFQVVNGGDGTCEVLFDDIRVTHLTTPYYEIEETYQQDFTKGLGYYTGNGPAFSLGTDPCNAANQVLRYTGKNAWDYEGQYSGGSFTAGQEYTLTFRYYAKSMTGAASSVVVQCGFSGKMENILIINRAKDDTGWIDVSYTFTAGAITNSTRLFQVVNGGDGKCEVFFDDIAVTRTVVYDEPVYTAGRYQTADGVWVLNTETGGEFYRDSLTMTPGHTYVIDYEVQTGGSYVTPYLMDRTNGNKRTDLNAYKVAENTDWTAVHIEYVCDGTDKAVDANGNIVYRLGFFRNSGGGTAAIRSIALRELVYPEVKTPALRDGSILPADSAMAEDARIFCGKITLKTTLGVPTGATYEGGSVNAAVSGLTAGKPYVLTYKVLTSYGDGNFAISGSIGDARWSLADFGQADGWLTVRVAFTASADGDATLTLANDNYVFYRDICLNRVYPYGDINGDDTVDIRDLVAYTAYLETEYRPATLAYADMDRNGTIDAADTALLRRALLHIE